MAEIFHYIKINTATKTVYRALTKQEGLASWWTKDVTAEPKIGSIAEFVFGAHYHDKMRILSLIPNTLVEWECLAGDKEWVGTRLRFDLESHPEHTVLRFKHMNWQEVTDFFAQCNTIWGSYMISLKNYCETGKGNPFSK
jgi:uncharacterized protein YndB with AHSA1/START domain